MPHRHASIEIGLNAVIVSVADGVPQIVHVNDPNDATQDGLPFGPFDPIRHRTFEIGLRTWVEDQTALRLGYIEQLYTFGDRGRHRVTGDEGPHVVSVGYLALTRQTPDSEETLAKHNSAWRSWYDYFPWEDWRNGRPPLLDSAILPALDAWAEEPPAAGEPPRALSRKERMHLAFGGETANWDEERALERFELLYEAGLVGEAKRDGRAAAQRRAELPFLGTPMRFDHRRVLATAISRLRGKLKYRPVIFELMPEQFTLTELQTSVEAISGRHLHKQNFRRLVENADLVEATGATSTATGGRPAALFRFRQQLLSERPAPGLRVGGR
ncbi:MAG: NAD regulator [Roseibium sp.]|uniref:NUDIX hydrolase n=1 Tax=Roseibium sp. TaxID=1936156 RepID=UPI001B26789D|nr:NAD regulator [Roseibium sp.]MBO6890711.1 NAD regulator [Roseibium sp.]MBO6932893.1 NAD regulator [Roseibium sp.]